MSYYYGASVATPSTVTVAAQADAQNGLLVVNVPENAKVYVNDYLTTSTGTQRQFLSKGLVDGKTYKYAVRVEVEQDGEVRTETRNVSLTAGNTIQVAFNELQPVETTLAINVPAGAKIVLEGQEMKSTGTIRVFTSNELKGGDSWKNYTVRVELEQDGEMLVKEQKIDLAGGDYKELSFDFAQRVASRE